MSGRPQLVWVIEPENKIRFRYLSEGGSHGGLSGVVGKKSSPTLKLKNYRGGKPISVRVRLYTEDEKEHVLEFKGKKGEPSKRFIEEPLQDDNTVIFKDIRIVSKKKDEIENILMERKISNLKDGMSPVVRNQLEKSYRKDVKERARAILNSVRLYFEAFEVDKPGVPLCSLLSDVICNQKAASKGDLRICRLSQCAGSWKGNDEIILLCEKVQKDNIKIKFFETNENGMIIWEAYGSFSPLDVHYQVAIPFKTPPYKKNIEKKVYICLERNEENSEPCEFTYKPDEPSSKKRKLEPFQYENQSVDVESSDSISSLSSPENAASNTNPEYSFPSDDSNPFDMPLPDDILGLLNNSFLCITDEYHSPFENIVDLCGSDEGFLAENEGNMTAVAQMDVLDGCVQIERVQQNSGTISKNRYVDRTEIDGKLKTLTIKEENKRKSVSDYLKGSMPKLVCKKILGSLLLRDDYGNSLLHITILRNQNIMSILKFCQVVNMLNVFLNLRNQKNQTALHLATEKNRLEAVRILLKYGSNPNLKDLYGNNCYHLAVKNDFPGVLEEINKFSRFPHEVSAFNDEGLSPLHIAITNKDPYLFYLLKSHVTSVSIVEKKAGRSLLHYAVAFQPILLPELFQLDDMDVNIQDFEGNTPLHFACARNNYEAVKILLYHGADACINNFKTSFENLEDDSEGGQLPSDLTEDKQIIKLLGMTVENIEGLYGCSNTKELHPDRCEVTERLAEYLDEEMKWKKLIPYYLDPDMEATLRLSPSPSKALLHYIKKQGPDNYIETLKTVLEMADLKDAVNILNK